MEGWRRREDGLGSDCCDLVELELVVLKGERGSVLGSEATLLGSLRDEGCECMREETTPDTRYRWMLQLNT